LEIRLPGKANDLAAGPARRLGLSDLARRILSVFFSGRAGLISFAGRVSIFFELKKKQNQRGGRENLAGTPPPHGGLRVICRASGRFSWNLARRWSLVPTSGLLGKLVRSFGVWKAGPTRKGPFNEWFYWGRELGPLGGAETDLRFFSRNFRVNLGARGRIPTEPGKIRKTTALELSPGSHCFLGDYVLGGGGKCSRVGKRCAEFDVSGAMGGRGLEPTGISRRDPTPRAPPIKTGR